MEDVEDSLAQRPRRARAKKDYKDQVDDDDDDDNAADDNEDSDESMEDDAEDEELQDDDDDMDSDEPRRSRRRRTKPVQSSLMMLEQPPSKKRGGVRTSSRSTKFTSSMAEPSATSMREFLKETATTTTHKSPARRHKQRRRSLTHAADHTPESSAEEEESETEEEEEMEEEEMVEEEGEPLKVQRIIASRTETLQKWKEIGAKMNTTEVTYGSRWFQKVQDDGDNNKESDTANAAFEERFLVKWSDISFLHVSWETETDLVEQADAKSYLTTFFRKSVGGLLYSQDERCDGDYFDPAYTQVERILEVQLPEDWEDPNVTRHEGDKYDYGMVMDRTDDPKAFDNGTGRQFLIKWGNLPYSDSTYEFERDLILNEIEYEEPLQDFLKRNQKPTKSEKRAEENVGKDEMKRLYPIFGDKATKGQKLSEEEREAAVDEYKKELQEHTYKNGGQLRDYQAEGVAWMISNFVNNRSCILGRSWLVFSIAIYFLFTLFCF